MGASGCINDGVRTMVTLGVMCCVAGVIWIAQGLNVLGGSGMSGHGEWAWIGAAAVLVGVALVRWRGRRGPTDSR